MDERDPVSLALTPRTGRPLGRAALRRLAATLAASRLGRLWIGYLVLERPELLSGALGSALSRDARFDRVAAWPRGRSE